VHYLGPLCCAGAAPGLMMPGLMMPGLMTWTDDGPASTKLVTLLCCFTLLYARGQRCRADEVMCRADEVMQNKWFE